MLLYFNSHSRSLHSNKNFVLDFNIAFLSFTTPFLSLFTFVPTSNWGLKSIIILSFANLFISFKIFKIEIKENKKINFFENQDIRTFVNETYFDIITCDVSFISIHNILEDIDKFAKDKIIILFKPQFEVGTNVKRDKKGVVKDKNAIIKSREKFLEYTKNLKWKLIYSSMSKLQGKDGNEEELFYFSK